MTDQQINGDNRPGTLKLLTGQTASTIPMYAFHTNSSGPREGPSIAAARANALSGLTNSAGAVRR